MKLLVLPRYGPLGASSRLRTHQYLDDFRAAGLDVSLQILLADRYVSRLYSRQSAVSTVLAGYFGRVRALLGSRSVDVVYTEKETLPWIPAMLELGLLNRRVRLVVDFDDAVFHRYDQHTSPMVRQLLGSKLDNVMRRADLVTVGNRYLADRARHAGCSMVELIPTVVDLRRYLVQAAPREAGAPVVVGWIGSPSTAHYLKLVAPALEKVGRECKIDCVAVGARPDQLVGTPFRAAPWSEATEVDSLRRFDIGIMPLPDAPWERGKCGYKLIQYMACSLPVVASPVGVNREIVREGENGFLAGDELAWTESIGALVRSASLRTRMGACGRSRVEQEFNLQIQGPRLAKLLLALGSS